MKSLSIGGNRLIAVIVAVCVALTCLMVAMTDDAYAASKKNYYAGLTTKNKIAYSDFTKDLSEETTYSAAEMNADLAVIKGELARVQSMIQSGFGGKEYDGVGDGDPFAVNFGTIKQKVTATVALGKLTTKKPKNGYVTFGKLKSTAAQKKYKKLKAKVKKKPINYFGSYYDFEEKNHPGASIKIGDELFDFFRVEYLSIKPVGKVKKNKSTLSGKYSVSTCIDYKKGTTYAQIEKYLAAFVATKSGNKWMFTFTTPTLKNKGTLKYKYKYGGNIFNCKTTSTYSGYSSISNKTFTATETITIK